MMSVRMYQKLTKTMQCVFTQRFFRWVVLSSFVVCFAAGVQAQESASAPLLINISRQLYRWSPGDSAPTPTGCDLQGNQLRLALYSLIESPDGRWAAFNVVPVGVGLTAPTATGNLWVCNLDTGEAYALSDTDPSYPYFVSDGAFSPDGSRIAWTEIVSNPAEMGLARVMVHDFASRQTRVLVDSTPYAGPCGVGQGAPRLIWGEAGIAMGYYLTPDNDPCDEAIEKGFYVYDPDNGARTAYPVSEMGFDDSGFEWVQIDNQPYLVYQFVNYEDLSLRVFRIDVTRASVSEVDGVLEAYWPSSSARYLVPEQVPPLIYIPGAEVPLESPADVALSPDGSRMAIVIGSQLYFAQQGNLEPAPWNNQFFPIMTAGGLDIPESFTGQLEIAWTPPAYRLVLGAAPQSVCPSVERLFFDWGFQPANIVKGLGANNLRSAPWPGAQILGSIPDGAVLTVIDTVDSSTYQYRLASVCTGGIRWREVSYQGMIGWTAEAQGDTYYLEPAS
jgi:hypothetical protein